MQILNQLQGLPPPAETDKKKVDLKQDATKDESEADTKITDGEIVAKKDSPKNQGKGEIERQ